MNVPHPQPPPAPVQRLLRPLARFLHIESASGIVLLACTGAALILTNSPWGPAFAALWQTEACVTVGPFELKHTLAHWINDGLMTVFFFVVGLEIKRELVAGELRDRARQRCRPWRRWAAWWCRRPCTCCWLEGRRDSAAGASR